MRMISGGLGADHNDVSFVVYISLSLWAWIEYIYSKKWWWIFFIGIFSGCAILCKWIVGLLIYFVWGISSVFNNKFHIKKYSDIILSLLITVIIVLPWQLFVLHRYPTEFKVEYEHTTQHFFEVAEGHDGSLFYYFNTVNEMFGSFVLYLIVPAFIIFYRKTLYKKASVSLIASILFVYLFFSFAQTKMPAYTFIVALPVYLSLGFLFDYLETIFNQIKISPTLNKIILFILVFLLAVSRMDLKAFKEIDGIFGRETEGFSRLSHNEKIFKGLSLPANAVIFNVNGDHYIEAMFYTGLTAYNFIPTKEQYLDVKRRKKVIALFPQPNDTIPSYLKEDSTVIHLKDTLQRWE